MVLAPYFQSYKLLSDYNTYKIKLIFMDFHLVLFFEKRKSVLSINKHAYRIQAQGTESQGLLVLSKECKMYLRER